MTGGFLGYVDPDLNKSSTRTHHMNNPSATLAPDDDAAWEPYRHDWPLPADTIYLNHGSFGPPPAPVRAARQSWMVVDLRSLRPLDRETLLSSVRKTGKCLIAYEDNRFGGYGAEIAAIVAEEAFDYLDGPVSRIAGPDVPAMPYNHALEDWFMLSPAKIADAIRKLAAYTRQARPPPCLLRSKRAWARWRASARWRSWTARLRSTNSTRA